MERNLKEFARHARDDLSRAPYSGFRVGCAIQTEDKVFYAGNVEFSGRYGIHAEQMAAAKALAEDSTLFKTVAVSCSDEGGHVPCGMCLHALSETTRDMVILLDEGGGWSETTMMEEMPNAWSGSNR